MSKHDDDTCPHLVRASLLEAENARLKADVVELADALKLASEVGIKVADEVTRLQAEVERLRKLFADTERLMLLDGEYEAAKVGTYARLKAEVERLRASSFVTAVPVEQYERVVKAGDACADAAYAHCMCQDCEELRDQWRDAKRGKQP